MRLDLAKAIHVLVNSGLYCTRDECREWWWIRNGQAVQILYGHVGLGQLEVPCSTAICSPAKNLHSILPCTGMIHSRHAILMETDSHLSSQGWVIIVVPRVPGALTLTRLRLGVSPPDDFTKSVLPVLKASNSSRSATNQLQPERETRLLTFCCGVDSKLSVERNLILREALTRHQIAGEALYHTS